jgi:hypothetical protein
MNLIFTGIDRCGKDFLASRVAEAHGLQIYHETQHNRDDFVNNPERYQTYLEDVTYEKLRILNTIDNEIFVRFHIDEYVFSELFGRDPIIPCIEKFEKLILVKPNIIVPCITYDTYVKRCENSDEVKVYTKKEFMEISDLYDKFLKRSSISYLYVSGEATPNNFEHWLRK